MSNRSMNNKIKAIWIIRTNPAASMPNLPRHTLPGQRLISRESDRNEMAQFWNLGPGHLRAEPGHDAVKMFEEGDQDDPCRAGFRKA